MRGAMERRPRDIVAVLAMSCLLLLPLLVSSVPMSRSLHLSRQHQHPPSLNLSADEMVAAAQWLDWKPMERMDVEVNDYPSPGANPRHDPKRPPSEHEINQAAGAGA